MSGVITCTVTVSGVITCTVTFCRSFKEIVVCKSDGQMVGWSDVYIVFVAVFVDESFSLRSNFDEHIVCVHLFSI